MVRLQIFKKVNFFSVRTYHQLPNHPLFKSTYEKCKSLEKVAVISNNENYSYSDLFSQISIYRNWITQAIGKSDISETRVSYLIPPSFDHVSLQWAVWASGGVAVPLCVTHPLNEMDYVIKDSQSDLLVAHEKFRAMATDLAKINNLKLLILPNNKAVNEEINFDGIPFDTARRALIIYTSGTTGSPKGVVITHDNILAQLKAITSAWKINNKDKLVHCLPLHHVHGVINAMNAPLYSGGCVHFLPMFSAERVVEVLLRDQSFNLFMAVPTIYSKLVQQYESYENEKRSQITSAFKKLRLMISGSSALPPPLLRQFERISGHFLLERYGMSEIGMGLTNPLSPVSARKEGSVGMPFPSVQVRLVEEGNDSVTIKLVTKDDTPGEIQILGPSVFKEYWNNPVATKKTFELDGWFKTGDIAVRRNGYYYILGRSSVDIIKNGGYKVSALEIEKELLSIPNITEAAVFGVSNQIYGEEIVALVSSASNQKIDFSKLRERLKSVLASYKVPTSYRQVESIPKNAMGKINKKQLQKSFMP